MVKNAAAGDVDEGDPVIRGSPAPAEASGGRGRRWRRRRTRRRGEAATVAARFTAARPWRRSVAVGEGGGDESGWERERRKDRGESGGEWEERPRGRGVGVLIPSSRRRRGGVRLGRALFRPGSGEQGKGTRCGSWAGWAGQAGCGPGGLGGGRAGGLGCLVQGASPLFLFFCNFFLLFIFPFCFI